MFTTVSPIDARERELVQAERLIARIRARQIELLRSLGADGIIRVDGSRSLTDWTAARLDVTGETARTLVAAAEMMERTPDVAGRLAAGDATFDRTVATARLAAAGASDEVIQHSHGLDLAGVRRITARHRRLATTTAQAAFRERHLTIQPSLDESTWRLWGSLPGFEGRIVEKALADRADSFPDTGEPRVTRAAARADALVSLAQDSLDGGTGTGGEPIVSVFVDAALAAPTRGQTGAEVATGPRVGPSTLERILCEGRVQTIVTDGNAVVSASPAARAIPPAIRRFVLARDSGCVIDGCTSRYRLQPHHITPYSHGGTHEAKNLATLCWHHHHVAIHGEGYRLDPNSPPHRRRLIHPSCAGPDPPHRP